MVRNYVRKTQDRYPREVMEAAVKAVCNGLPYRKASIQYGIPFKTLERHVLRAKHNLPIRIKGGYKFYTNDSIPSLDQSDAGTISADPEVQTKPSVARKCNPTRSCKSTGKGSEAKKTPSLTRTKKTPSLPENKERKENYENKFSNGKLTDDTLSFVTMVGIKLDRMTKKARLATQMKICQIVFESELNSLKDE